MKKLATTALAALMVLALGYESPSAAQGGTPSGDSLHAQADGLRKAFLSGTPDEFYAKLAPWMQGRAELSAEKWSDKMTAELADESKEDQERLKREFINDFKKWDPAGLIGIDSWEEFLDISAAKIVALEMQMSKLRADEETAERRNARWHQVRRTIYTRTEKFVVEDEWIDVQRTHGVVMFMNRFDDTFEVQAVAEGDTWRVVEVSVGIAGGDIKLTDSKFLEEPDAGSVRSGSLSTVRAEGEILMGSARDVARVEYSKTGEVPKKFSDWIEVSELEGEHYRVRDTIYKKPDADRGAVVVEPIENKVAGWGALYFTYASGGGDFRWYDSENDLEEALKNFQTAK